MDLLSSDENPLASPEELTKIAELRTRFAGDLEKRKAAGRLPEAFFGDIKLTRLLRGNDGDMERSVLWFERYLRMYDSVGVDEMLPRLPDVTTGGRIDLSTMPGAKMLDHARFIWNAERLTPRGDVICYLPLSDFSVQGLVENGLFDDRRDYGTADVLLRDLHLDHMSRQQGRLAKVVWVIDFTGASLVQLVSPSMMRYEKEHCFPIVEALSVEIVHMTILANAPRWARSMWDRVFLPFMPEHFARRVVFLGSDWTTDRLLLRYVGVDQVATFVASRLHKGDGAGEENSGTRAIEAGSSFERVFQAKPGQCYSWSFEVESGGFGDRVAGVPDIEFSVVMVVDGEGEEFGEQVFVRSQEKFGSDSGQITGSYDVEKAGMLIVRWSNTHSWLRGKTIKFEVAVPS